MTTTPEDLKDLFLNAEKFYVLVHEKVELGKLSYIEAIMAVCDELDINPEDLMKVELISPLLKSKLEEEAIELGLLKDTSRLPV